MKNDRLIKLEEMKKRKDDEWSKITKLQYQRFLDENEMKKISNEMNARKKQSLNLKKNQ